MKQEGEKLFTFPTSIDVYESANLHRTKVWITQREQQFEIPCQHPPMLINFDGDKVLLCKKQENKTATQYLFQFENSKNFIDKMEAVQFALKNNDSKTTDRIIQKALQDKNAAIVTNILTANSEGLLQNEEVASLVENIAAKDKRKLVRAAAIELLGTMPNKKYIPLFEQATTDSSYSVAGQALKALLQVDSEKAQTIASKLRTQEAKGILLDALASVMAEGSTDEALTYLNQYFATAPINQDKFNLGLKLIGLLKKTDNTLLFQEGVSQLLKMHQAVIAILGKDYDKGHFVFLLKELSHNRSIKQHPADADFVNQQINELEKEK